MSSRLFLRVVGYLIYWDWCVTLNRDIGQKFEDKNCLRFVIYVNVIMGSSCATVGGQAISCQRCTWFESRHQTIFIGRVISTVKNRNS